MSFTPISVLKSAKYLLTLSLLCIISAQSLLGTVTFGSFQANRGQQLVFFNVTNNFDEQIQVIYWLSFINCTINNKEPILFQKTFLDVGESTMAAAHCEGLDNTFISKPKLGFELKFKLVSDGRVGTIRDYKHQLNSSHFFQSNYLLLNPIPVCHFRQQNSTYKPFLTMHLENKQSATVFFFSAHYKTNTFQNIYTTLNSSKIISTPWICTKELENTQTMMIFRDKENIGYFLSSKLFIDPFKLLSAPGNIALSKYTLDNNVLEKKLQFHIDLTSKESKFLYTNFTWFLNDTISVISKENDEQTIEKVYSTPPLSIIKKPAESSVIYDDHFISKEFSTKYLLKTIVNFPKPPEIFGETFIDVSAGTQINHTIYVSNNASESVINLCILDSSGVSVYLNDGDLCLSEFMKKGEVVPVSLIIFPEQSKGNITLKTQHMISNIETYTELHTFTESFQDFIPAINCVENAAFNNIQCSLDIKNTGSEDAFIYYSIFTDADDDHISDFEHLSSGESYSRSVKFIIPSCHLSEEDKLIFYNLNALYYYGKLIKDETSFSTLFIERIRTILLTFEDEDVHKKFSAFQSDHNIDAFLSTLQDRLKDSSLFIEENCKFDPTINAYTYAMLCIPPEDDSGQEKCQIKQVPITINRDLNLHLRSNKQILTILPDKDASVSLEIVNNHFFSFYVTFEINSNCSFIGQSSEDFLLKDRTLKTITLERTKNSKSAKCALFFKIYPKDVTDLALTKIVEIIAADAQKPFIEFSIDDEFALSMSRENTVPIYVKNIGQALGSVRFIINGEKQKEELEIGPSESYTLEYTVTENLALKKEYVLLVHATIENEEDLIFKEEFRLPVVFNALDVTVSGEFSNGNDIIITNEGNEKTKVTLSMRGEMSKCIFLSSDSFTLYPEKSKKLRIDINCDKTKLSKMDPSLKLLFAYGSNEILEKKVTVVFDKEKTFHQNLSDTGLTITNSVGLEAQQEEIHNIDDIDTGNINREKPIEEKKVTSISSTFLTIVGLLLLVLGGAFAFLYVKKGKVAQPRYNHRVIKQYNTYQRRY